MIVLVGGAPTAAGTADDQPLRAALEARDVDVRMAAWNDPSVAWASARAVVIRSPWEIYRTGQRDPFCRWASQVARHTCVLPAPPVLWWNTDKRYLHELEGSPVAVLPTRVLPAHGTPRSVLAQIAGLGAELVVKPAVGASGHDTRWVTRAEAPGVIARMHAAGNDVVVQPFRPSVRDRGERSVIVIEGRPTHAVVKRPAMDDFRVQRHFGGSVASHPLTPGLADHATSVVANVQRHLGQDLPWVRVDELVDEDGRAELLEFEATDPWLHLERCPEAAAAMAETILASSSSSEARPSASRRSGEVSAEERHRPRTQDGTPPGRSVIPRGTWSL